MQSIAHIELKGYRKLLLKCVCCNVLFRYTLIKTLRLNRATASVHGVLIIVVMLQHCSSTECITCVGQMVSVHGKNGMQLIFLGNRSIAELFPPTKPGYTASLLQPNQGDRETLYSERCAYGKFTSFLY